ncbi:MAG TPA: NAD(P)-binding domain-containing protein [Thermoplasmata archaeon]|nr:NAD(P)-binding domain-containing protein [Thermoplasmata archaeon]
MEIRLLFERDIRALIGPKEAIPAVRDAFARLARGQAVLPGTIGLDLPEDRVEVHVKGAHLRGSPAFTIKVAGGSYDNPSRGLPVGHGLVMAFDAKTSFLRAILFDNGYLTDLRTGAAGAVAADLLARRRVERVGIVGVGVQARAQLEALLQVRTPDRVIAFGRDARKAAAYAEEMEARHGARVLPAKTAEQAVRGSDIVITATPAHEPIVRATWVGPGAHVTAVGSDGPEKQELDVGVIGKADKVVADRWDQCVRLGEIHHAVEAGVFARERLHAELGEICAGLKPGRTSDDEITVADLTGVGVQDAAVANVVLEAAARRDLGQTLEI